MATLLAGEALFVPDYGTHNGRALRPQQVDYVDQRRVGRDGGR